MKEKTSLERKENRLKVYDRRLNISMLHMNFGGDNYFAS